MSKIKSYGKDNLSRTNRWVLVEKINSVNNLFRSNTKKVKLIDKKVKEIKKHILEITMY